MEYPKKSYLFINNNLDVTLQKFSNTTLYFISKMINSVLQIFYHKSFLNFLKLWLKNFTSVVEKILRKTEITVAVQKSLSKIFLQFKLNFNL